MTKTYLGTIDLSALNDLGGIDFNYTASGGTRSKKYYCDAGSVDSLIMQIPDECPEQPLCNCLQNIVARNLEAKGVIEVTATWSTPYYDYPTYPENTVEKQITREVKMFPIDDPQLVNSGIYTAAERNQAKRRGWRVLPVASIRYTYSKYINGWDWSESNITNMIGNIGAPPEIDNATDWKWFRESTEASKTGSDQTRVTEVWVYSAAGWNFPQGN